MQQVALSRFAKVFKLLGHSKRLEIATLLQGHSLTVNHIVQMTAIRQAAISQHLTLLKKYGLVSVTKIGKEVYYTLLPDKLIKLTEITQSLTRRHPLETAEPSVTDPVCRMVLTPNTASYTKQYGGVRHYFCGKGCLDEFRRLHT